MDKREKISDSAFAEHVITGHESIRLRLKQVNIHRNLRKLKSCYIRDMVHPEVFPNELTDGVLFGRIDAFARLNPVKADGTLVELRNSAR